MRGDNKVVWNFPIDITFKSSNIYGWPRIAVSVYGMDFLGRDVARGYGSAVIPLVSGQHVIEVDMYTPLAMSLFNSWAGWLTGNPPEVSKMRMMSDVTIIMMMMMIMMTTMMMMTVMMMMMVVVVVMMMSKT